MDELQIRRKIVDLLPGYLLQRRTGWMPRSELSCGITLPEYLLLRRVAIERDDGPIPYDQLRANLLNPYSTIDPILDGLPRLVELELLAQLGDAYTLPPAGHELLRRGERAANDYAAHRLRMSPDDLVRLASLLSGVAMRLHQAPEPAEKAHQDRVPRLRRFTRARHHLSSSNTRCTRCSGRATMCTSQRGGQPAFVDHRLTC